MTDASNVTTTVATGVAETVVTTVADNAKTAATAEVTSLSTHWHIPVWAVIVILALGAVAVVHFL